MNFFIQNNRHYNLLHKIFTISPEIPCMYFINQKSTYLFIRCFINILNFKRNNITTE